MALLNPITRIPTLGSKGKAPKRPTIQKEERVSFSKLFADNLKMAARHVDIVDLEHGKKIVEDVATFALEGNPLFLLRVKANLAGINTKLELQKYVYNSILRGEKLYVR